MIVSLLDNNVLEQFQKNMNALIAEEDAGVAAVICNALSEIARRHRVDITATVKRQPESVWYLAKADILITDITEKSGKMLAAHAMKDANVPVLGMLAGCERGDIVECDLLYVILTPEFNLKKFERVVLEFYERYRELDEARKLKRHLRAISLN